VLVKLSLLVLFLALNKPLDRVVNQTNLLRHQVAELVLLSLQFLLTLVNNLLLLDLRNLVIVGLKVAHSLDRSLDQRLLLVL
jgi:hypothetical protein